MISDPEPTDVIPTISPPTTPMSTVGTARTWSDVSAFRRTSAASSRRPSAYSRATSRICRKALAAIDTVARSSATPRATRTVSCTPSPAPSARTANTPAKAEGTDPRTRNRTRRRLTEPCRRWTALPTGFMKKDATRSLETAASGWTPEEQDEDRGHQGPAAHARQPDGEADEHPREGDEHVEVEVHVRSLVGCRSATRLSDQRHGQEAGPPSEIPRRPAVSPVRPSRPRRARIRRVPGGRRARPVTRDLPDCTRVVTRRHGRRGARRPGRRRRGGRWA